MAIRTRDDLMQDLRDQVELLGATCATFDGGLEIAAKQLAVIARVLLYDKPGSPSLLTQLVIQDRLPFWDSSRPLPGTRGLAHVWSAGLAVVELSSGPAKYKAPLGEIEGRWIPFGRWWGDPILYDQAGERFSRADIVLFLVHKDGGGHIDPKIARRWEALTRLNSLDFATAENMLTVGSGGGSTSPMGNPLMANMRQIAFEILETFNRRLTGWLHPGTT
jgi:hypothetical protein